MRRRETDRDDLVGRRRGLTGAVLAGASRSDPLELVALAAVVQEIGTGVVASAVRSGIVTTARSVFGRLLKMPLGDAHQSFRISITVIDAKGPVQVEAEVTGADAAERGRALPMAGQHL